MSYTSIILPEHDRHVPGTYVQQGILWFPDLETRSRWCEILGPLGSGGVILRCGLCMLQLDILVGIPALLETQEVAYQILYLPWDGLSDPRLNYWLTHEQPDRRTFFFYLFHRNELALFPGEQSPSRDLFGDVDKLQELLAGVHKYINAFPFLGILDAEDTHSRFTEWLRDIVIDGCLEQCLSKMTEDLQQLEHNVQEILESTPPLTAAIADGHDLYEHLKFFRQGRALLAQLAATVTVHEEAGSGLGEAREARQSLAIEQYEVTGKSVYGTEFVYRLGDELAPPSLLKIMGELKVFAAEIREEGVPDLETIGIEIENLLRDPLPVLALIGSYSSGKTTLLNMLLLGKDSKRAFRTRAIANTAMVAISHSARWLGQEKVKFYGRKRISVGLLNRHLKISIHQRLLQALQHLIEKQALTQTYIDVTILSSVTKDRQEFERERKDASAAVLEFLAILQQGHRVPELFAEGVQDAVFHANVDWEVLAAQFGVARELDLSSDEAWSVFQGDGKAGTTFAESLEASILFEKADIWLHNPLLDITSIADTPGTGSWNARHDEVTNEYLDHADGYIVLLPTKNQDAERVFDVLLRVRQALARRSSEYEETFFRSVAFVVNCFADQGKANLSEKIRLFEEHICRALGISGEKWNSYQVNPRERDFFVVQLKHMEAGQNPELLYGYPSIIPLRGWIERLFQSDVYLKRYSRALNLLEQHWHKSYQNLLDQLKKLKMKQKERLALADQVKEFYQEKLPTLTDAYDRQIDEFRDEFHTSPRSEYARTNELLDSFCTNPSDLPERGRRALLSRYEQLNNLLESYDDTNPAVAWELEIEARLQELNVSLPPLHLPQPAAQSKPWDFRRKFDIWRVEEKFDAIQEKWPTGWRLSFQALRGMIKILGRDFRQALAEELRNEFWHTEYHSIWDDCLETYLKRSEKYLEESQGVVMQHCQDWENQLRDPAWDSQADIVQGQLDIFDANDARRQDLIHLIEQTLNG